MERIPVLVNRKARALATAAGLQRLASIAQEAGVDIEVIPTETTAQMTEQVRKLVAAETPRIAVAGGDGTVSHAVQGLAHTDTSLGIIPMGTFNNFASALRLPMDVPSAFRAVRDGVVQEIDLGKVGEIYFTEAAGVGLFADALAIYGIGTNKSFFRGTYAMLRMLLVFRPRRLRLKLDGELHTERAIMCTIANTYRMSSALGIAPGARLTDGLLNVVVAGDLHRSELVRYYLAVRAQVHEGLPKVTTHEARTVEIASRRPINVHADDRVVTRTPATVEVQPKALKVVVDRL